MTLYLSRLTLSRTASNAALSALLDPAESSAAANAHHRLLWTLFADGPDRKRDFLWRADGNGRFFVLSARPPQQHDLFAAPEVKDFAPSLAVGDRLSFVLRANATKDRAAIGRLPAGQRAGKSRRVDLVMELLHAVPKGQRAEARQDLAKQAATEWFNRQAGANGFEFSPDDLILNDYSTISLPRQAGKRASHAKFGILDLAGTIRITDPVAFVTRLSQGFGRARAFGCGLMLIRRV